MSFEIRGFGVPQEDVGRAGDIFWDMTRPYILYVCGPGGWVPWNPGASSGKQALAEHPLFHDRYMWISGSGLTWLTNQGLTNKGLSVKQPYALDENVQLELKAILDATSNSMWSMESPHSRAGHGAEVAGRNKSGIAVQTQDETQPAKRKRVPSSSHELSLVGTWVGNRSHVDLLPPSSSSTVGDIPLYRRVSRNLELNRSMRCWRRKTSNFGLKEGRRNALESHNKWRLLAKLSDAGNLTEEHATIAQEENRKSKAELETLRNTVRQVVNLPALAALVKGAGQEDVPMSEAAM
ncbi:hypothetical protein C8R43DRAFT_943586 [Mycena crocata]|nr:hypothetical protein C8R43DRAFT_943586 [Mycena crocata]